MIGIDKQPSVELSETRVYIPLKQVQNNNQISSIKISMEKEYKSRKHDRNTTKIFYSSHQRNEQLAYYLNFVNYPERTLTRKLADLKTSLKAFQVELSIHNQTEQDLSQVKVIQTGSKIAPDLHRVLSIPKLPGKQQNSLVIHNWPIIEEPKEHSIQKQHLSHSYLDHFEISFYRHLKKEKGQHILNSMVTYSLIQVNIRNPVDKIHFNIHKSKDETYQASFYSECEEHLRTKYAQTHFVEHNGAFADSQINRLVNFCKQLQELSLKQKFQQSTFNLYGQEPQSCRQSINRIVQSPVWNPRKFSGASESYSDHHDESSGMIYLQKNPGKNSSYFAVLDQLAFKLDEILPRLLIFQKSERDHLCVLLNVKGNLTPIEINSDVLRRKDNILSFYLTTFRQVPPRLSDKQKNIVKMNAILEKCFAKIAGQYSYLSQKEVGAILMMITSCPTTYHCHQEFDIYIEYLKMWGKTQKDIHLITISLQNVEQQLKSLFQNTKGLRTKDFRLMNERVEEFQKGQVDHTFEHWVQKYLNLFFSFRGLEEIVDKEGLVTYFGKLAAPEGKQMAQPWNQRWCINRGYSFYPQQNIIKIGSSKIHLQENEMLIALDELKHLKANVAVCIYKQIDTQESQLIQIANLRYCTQSIYFTESTTDKLIIEIKEPQSECCIALHHENKDMSGKEGQISYPESFFQLKIEEQGQKEYLKFLGKKSKLNYTFFKYMFQNAGTYQLKLGLKNEDRPHNCVVSLFSNSKKNRLLKRTELKQSQLLLKSNSCSSVQEDKQVFDEYKQQWTDRLKIGLYIMELKWRVVGRQFNRHSQLPKKIMKVVFADSSFKVIKSEYQNQSIKTYEEQNLDYIEGVYRAIVKCSKVQKYLAKIKINNASLLRFIQDRKYELSVKLEFSQSQEMLNNIVQQQSSANIVNHPESSMIPEK